MSSQAGSIESNLFKDAYFTHPDDVDWCLDQLRRIYGLEGKTALEPAAGSCVFPKASPEVSWTTNELYPEFSDGIIHDYNLNFLQDDRGSLGQFDFVIGNPPYGRASTWARKFVLLGLEHSDVVAMVLPKALRRHNLWDKYFPDDCEVVFEEPLPNSTFSLPDGQTREVGTFFLILERVPGYSRGKMLDYEPIGYRAAERRFDRKIEKQEDWWYDWATHGVCCWGSSGLVFDRSRSKSLALTVMMKLTDDEAEKVKAVDWAAIVDRTKTSVPMISVTEVYTAVNRALANG